MVLPGLARQNRITLSFPFEETSRFTAGVSTCLAVRQRFLGKSWHCEEGGGGSQFRCGGRIISVSFIYMHLVPSEEGEPATAVKE